VPLGMPRRHLGIGIALAAVIVLLAGILLLRGRRPVERTEAIQSTFRQLTNFAGEELQPSISPDGDTLAYVSSEAGDANIYLLRVGGQNPINLTEGSRDDDYQPAFSPDGELIAFRSEREGGGIFLMGATGESARRLSDFGYSPSWSPDGKQIVVCSEKNLDPWNRFPPSSLWLIEVATGQRRKIHDGDAVQPQWSPNGNRIAFWGLPRLSGERDIGSIAAAGGDLQWVTTDPAFDWNPVWSADGSYLYFASDRGGSMNLWRVPMDPETGRSVGDPEAVTTPSRYVNGLAIPREGKKIVFVSSDYRSNIQRLAFDPDRERVAGGPYPVTRGTVESGACNLSPDGQWIVYTTYRGQEDLFVIQADGTNLRRLTNDRYKDRGPSWSPDGNRIAFYSDRGGNYQIWAINRDGSGLRQLTTTSGGTAWFFPRWSPDGSRLAATEFRSAAIFALTGGAASSPEILPKLEGGTFFVSGWSPDGKKLIGGQMVSATVIDALILYDLSARRYSVIDAFDPTPFASAGWIDNRRVVYNGATSLKLMDVTTGKAKVIYQTESGRLGSVTTSRDGRTIAFTVRTTEADLWLATLQ
jgi:Tol biopolymer transport system component